jgi:RNA polymerase sigma-70 factor (family 1)
MANRALPPDGDLIDRIRSGDTSVLRLLVDAYWEPLAQYAAGIVEGVADPQDVVQNTFVRLWARRERWSTEGSVRALLYTVTRRMALDARRGTERRDRVARSVDPPAPASTPADEIELRELQEAAARAVSALPARRQEIFRLAREEGLTYQEIASVLELSPQTVANHMSLALTDLRKALAPWLDS